MRFVFLFIYDQFLWLFDKRHLVLLFPQIKKICLVLSRHLYGPLDIHTLFCIKFVCPSNCLCMCPLFCTNSVKASVFIKTNLVTVPETRRMPRGRRAAGGDSQQRLQPAIQIRLDRQRTQTNICSDREAVSQDTGQSSYWSVKGMFIQYYSFVLSQTEKSCTVSHLDHITMTMK